MQSVEVVTHQRGPGECLSVVRIVGRVEDDEVSLAHLVGRYTPVGGVRKLIRDDSARAPKNPRSRRRAPIRLLGVYSSSCPRRTEHPRPTSECRGIGIDTMFTHSRKVGAAAPPPHPQADL